MKKWCSLSDSAGRMFNIFCSGRSFRSASILCLAFVNIRLLSYKLVRTNRISRFLSPTVATSFSFRPLRSVSHVIDSFVCTEVKIDFNVRGISSITILEANAEAQEALIEKALDEKSIAAEEDPYGSVLWPSAKTVSMRLLQLDLHEKTVLELGTGTGLVSLTAALSGAKSVLATDYSLFSLSLVEKARDLQHVPISAGILTTSYFDIKDLNVPLPPADIVVIADLLYDKGLAVAAGKRVCEAYKRGSLVIVGNSPGRCGTPDMLRTCREILGFECVFLKMPGQTVVGHRHDLIGSVSSEIPQPIETTLLELQLK